MSYIYDLFIFVSFRYILMIALLTNTLINSNVGNDSKRNRQISFKESYIHVFNSFQRTLLKIFALKINNNGVSTFSPLIIKYH